MSLHGLILLKYMVLSIMGFIFSLIALRACIACNPFSKVMYAVQAYRTPLTLQKAAIGLPETLPMVDTAFIRESTIHGMPPQLPPSRVCAYHVYYCVYVTTIRNKKFNGGFDGMHGRRKSYYYSVSYTPPPFNGESAYGFTRRYRWGSVSLLATLMVDLAEIVAKSLRCLMRCLGLDVDAEKIAVLVV